MGIQSPSTLPTLCKTRITKGAPCEYSGKEYMLVPLGKFMESKWIHKEDWWYNGMKDGYGELIPLSHSNFIEWLNEQCEDGWEVLKISRDFNSEWHSTWVVFRKQAEN